MKTLRFVGLSLTIVGILCVQTVFPVADNYGSVDPVLLRNELMRIGPGVDSTIEVWLVTGDKLSGYIQEIGDQSFDIVEKKSAQVRTIPFSAVKGAKAKKMSHGKKIAIVVGITVGVLAILALIFGNRD